MPVLRNPQYYFKEGFCWTDVNSIYLKSRIKKSGVFDVLSMSMFSKTNIPDLYFVCLINSRIISFYVNNFINNTSHFQINDARQLPIIIPSENQLKNFIGVFNDAILVKKNQFLGKISIDNAVSDLFLLQEKLDQMVAILYQLV
jgi:hypothetical protein